MSAQMTARGLKYLEARAALLKLPGDHEVLCQLLFEMAVLEGQRADGKPSPREAEFRKAWLREAVASGLPPEVVRILGS